MFEGLVDGAKAVYDWVGIDGSIVTTQNFVAACAIYVVTEILKKLKFKIKRKVYDFRPSEGLLPIVPVFLGILVSLLGGMDLGTITDNFMNRVMFGIFAGSSASIVYKIWRSSLKAKLDQITGKKPKSEPKPEEGE